MPASVDLNVAFAAAVPRLSSDAATYQLHVVQHPSCDNNNQHNGMKVLDLYENRLRTVTAIHRPD